MTLAVEQWPQVEVPTGLTEEQFVAWCPDDVRAEYRDGEVIIMSPVDIAQDSVQGLLAAILRIWVEQHDLGSVTGDSFTVRLRPGLRRVPDLTFVAQRHAMRVRRTFIEGAPDAVFEIVSPESRARDWRDKHHDYQAAGVPEYWLIDPQVEEAHLYRLNARGEYEDIAEDDGRLVSEAIAGFWLRPAWLFSDPLPKVLDCLAEIEARGANS